ncbi:hypothetical protein [Salarchaeum sp. JOR-1]|uniref:hypothetical protein n=1 Tax=Salarchaeum sp. JOR-1 TaxID=2599399 RepID=UPI0011987E82|nr:hypothetical protein [Salarchaeum sp. JOR-1]QDX41571.1 hypothetical protein FQU85_11900 [Salarchaeum sp. JOR-1]
MTSADPRDLIRRSDAFTLAEFHDMVDDAETILDLQQAARVDRVRTIRLLKACGRYDEFDRGPVQRFREPQDS